MESDINCAYMEDNMQPDSPAPQPEEKQPELSAKEMPIPEQSPTPDKKHAKRNVAAIVLGLFVFILLVAVAGLGYWAYTLNTELASTEQELATLQGEHEQLQSDYAAAKSDNEKLTTDLDQVNADLEKTNEDLTTTQADLSNSQDQNKNLNTQFDTIEKKVEVLYAIASAQTVSDYLAIDALVNATNDNQLITQWNNFADLPSDQGAADFLLYLITAIRDELR